MNKKVFDNAFKNFMAKRGMPEKYWESNWGWTDLYQFAVQIEKELKSREKVKTK